MDVSPEAHAPLLTTAEVARYLRVSPMTVRRWAASGELPARRAGSLYRFAREDVETFASLPTAGVQ